MFLIVEMAGPMLSAQKLMLEFWGSNYPNHEIMT